MNMLRKREKKTLPIGREANEPINYFASLVLIVIFIYY